MVHSVDLNDEYYALVEDCTKNFEVRLNDRDYRVGDWLMLSERTDEGYTGRWFTRRIGYILPLDEFGLKDWVVMQLY